MTRRAIAVAAAVAFAAPLLAAPLSAQQLDRPTLHLLGIAVEDYGVPALRQHGALADGHAVQDSLVALNGGFYALHRHLLLGPEATRDAVLAAMDCIRRDSRPGDVVVLHLRALGGPRFIILADTLPLPSAPSAPGERPPPSFERRLLRAESLAQWMLSLPAREQLLLLDAPNSAALFAEMRESLAAPLRALRATRDLTVLAVPGIAATVTDAAGGSHSAMGLALLRALGDERRDAPIRLASALANRVLDQMNEPVMVHQAGADLVLGSSEAPLARANAAALRDPTPWMNDCGSQCPQLTLLRLQHGITVRGRASGLPDGARLFVNGRRARQLGEEFEVELPPAAARAELRLRVLLPDGTRYETAARLP